MRNAAGRPAWCLTYRGLDGRRRRERTDAVTKEEAQGILRRRMSEQTDAEAKGLQSLEHLNPMPFETFYNEQYLPYVETRVRPSTFQRKGQLAKHVLPFFGALPLRVINAGHIEKFMQQRASADPKPSAGEINRERNLVSAVLNTAFRRGLVDSNPVARVRPLKEDNALDRWLTPWEVERILDKAEEFVRPFIVVAVNTGLRVGELCVLEWSDVDFERGFLKVGQESKSHRIRYVPVNSVVRAVLDSLPRIVGLPWVFVNLHRQEAYRPDSVYHSFKKAAMEAEVEGAVFHTTRHTFASWLIQKGVPIAEVQQYLGHASDIMTRRYSHLAPATGRRNALEVLVSAQNGVSVAKEVAPKKGAM